MILLLPLFALWTSRLAGAEQGILPVLAAGLGRGSRADAQAAVRARPGAGFHRSPRLYAVLAAHLRAGELDRRSGCGDLRCERRRLLSDIHQRHHADGHGDLRADSPIAARDAGAVPGAAVRRRATAARGVVAAGTAAFAGNASCLCAAACGFFLVFILQGKGWPYHGYPTLALVCIVLAVALSSRDPPGPRPTHGEGSLLAFGMAAVACATFYWLNLANSVTMLNEPIRRLARQSAPGDHFLRHLGWPSAGAPGRRHLGQSRRKPLGHGRRAHAHARGSAGRGHGEEARRLCGARSRGARGGHPAEPAGHHRDRRVLPSTGRHGRGPTRPWRNSLPRIGRRPARGYVILHRGGD